MNATYTATYPPIPALELVESPSSPEPVTTQPQPRWTLATRIAFRFVFSYFVLSWGPDLLSIVPGIGYLSQRFEDSLNKAVAWTASHILHFSYPVVQPPFTGSGDTAYAYVSTFVLLLIALLTTLIWSVIDRKSPSYPRLYRWLNFGIRISLGISMLRYGSFKVIPAQMPPPTLSRLLETYGDSSPMTLLWTFIGASRPYEIFCGSVEMLGGILLFVPALATLGALISVAAMTQVFLLNMCYDVPVKLFSFQLLLMAVFLVAPDARRLADLFIFHRNVQLRVVPLVQRKWLNRTLLVLQLVVGFGLATLMLVETHQEAKTGMVKPPHYGVWSVEEFSVEGKLQPALPSEATRWRRMILDHPQRITVQFESAPQQRYELKQDTARNSLTLIGLDELARKQELTYREVSPDWLELNGMFEGHEIHAKLHRMEDPEFRLTSRGFHWINEFPNKQ